MFSQTRTDRYSDETAKGGRITIAIKRGEAKPAARASPHGGAQSRMQMQMAIDQRPFTLRWLLMKQSCGVGALFSREPLGD